MRAVLIASAAACLTVGSASAQSEPSLDDFVTRANRIPLNPTAMLRPDAHRLKAEADRSFTTIGREIREARAEGRNPPACPAGQVSVNPRQLLDFLNRIPQSRRRGMTVTEGIRQWMRSRYPCPGG